MARITAADGRSLIVAFDHGIGGANFAGMARPGQTLANVVAAGADAVLVSVGLAEAYGDTLYRVGLILNLDTCTGNEEVAVRQALELGADMGKLILTPWSQTVPESTARARHLGAVCHSMGLPLMLEPIPVSFAAVEEHTPENIGKAARIACEVGADVVKMQYPGDADEFRRIMGTLFRPVVILGGPQRPDERGLLQAVREAMDAGAMGVAIGRNIWGHDRPDHIVAALAAIIHEDASVDVALRALNGAVAVSR
jgi:DhnA family fructose-bisphosphate aldolase class Ia